MKPRVVLSARPVTDTRVDQVEDWMATLRAWMALENAQGGEWLALLSAHSALAKYRTARLEQLGERVASGD